MIINKYEKPKTIEELKHTIEVCKTLFIKEEKEYHEMIKYNGLDSTTKWSMQQIVRQLLKLRKILIYMQKNNLKEISLAEYVIIDSDFTHWYNWSRLPLYYDWINRW